MTYTVKEKNGKFHLYNTSTKRMLSRSFDSPVEAKASITRLNKRGTGVKKYHSCCRNHGCGKKGKKKRQSEKSILEEIFICVPLTTAGVSVRWSVGLTRNI